MHCIEMTEANERELRRDFTHHKCAQVRLRCLVVQLRGHGLPQGQVETLTGAATSSQTLWARQWQSRILEPLLEQASKKEISLWFVDAAHFTMLTGLGYLWSVMVCWVRSMAGRKRHSVLAALNAVTHQLVTVTTDLTVNAETMKDLRSKLHAMVGETGTKTVIILDNSRYQHCAAVKQWAEELGIILEFLPGYSPHLNLIERVWKFIRKTKLNNRYFSDFKLWSNAIDDCIEDINAGKHEAALKSLPSWDF